MNYFGLIIEKKKKDSPSKRRGQTSLSLAAITLHLLDSLIPQT
jgi:hypothetical protein